MINDKSANTATKPIKVWSEINVARFSWFLFPPTSSPLANTPRSLEIPSSDSDSKPGQINITPSLRYRAPDQFSYDVLLAVVSLWRKNQENGNATIKTSLRAIARVLGISGGKKNTTRIYNALLSLHYTHFQFVDSWRIDDNTTHHQDKHFSFISLVEQNFTKTIRGEGQKFTSEHLEINLPQQILSSLESPKACCVSLSQRRALTDSNAKLLYSHVDRIIAKTGKWNKNGDKLLEWFLPHKPALCSPKRKSDFLNKLVRDLDGTVTSWGTRINASVEDSLSSTLPKLVFRTETAPPAKVRSFSKLSNNDEDTVEMIEYEMSLILKVKQEDIHKNAGLDMISKYGDLETVRITIANIKEDVREFTDIANLLGFFVDRFKKISNERGTQNPFSN